MLGGKRLITEVAVYGTTKPEEPSQKVVLGPLSFLVTRDAIRRISWHGVELVRGVSWPIRDENWGTYTPEVIDHTSNQSDADYSSETVFQVADGALRSVLTVQAAASGEMQFNIAMTPTAGAFSTNRAGFTVLHPIADISGAALEVTHSDGTSETTDFPRTISAGQPVFDIQALRYGADDATTEITFAGEVFEMEDQRNWSDASYKTYCVPLVFPFTYTIDAPIEQGIRLKLAGQPGTLSSGNGGQSVRLSTTEDVVPEIGLAIEPGWLDAPGMIEESGAGYVNLRVPGDVPDEVLVQIASTISARPVDLEVVLADDANPSDALPALRDRIAGAGLQVGRVTALRESYLGSYQPTGDWPDGPTPDQVTDQSRAAFPDANVGGGMLTNFTEFNRCPPDPKLSDFVTFSSTAIVHAGDDLSVCETLETLPQIFDSAAKIAGQKAIRLGLVSIGMRTNPYGADVMDNPDQVRCTMARHDPRHRGLFGAAWAVGVLAATEGTSVDALCLAAPSGPFGLGPMSQHYAQPYFDDAGAGAVFPLFHVVRAATGMSGAKRLSISGLPAGVHGVAAQTVDGRAMIVANVTPDPCKVELEASGRVAVLDTGTFEAATKQLDWLEKTQRHETKQVDLPGFAVAFVDLKAA